MLSFLDIKDLPNIEQFYTLRISSAKESQMYLYTKFC